MVAMPWVLIITLTFINGQSQMLEGNYQTKEQCIAGAKPEWVKFYSGKYSYTERIETFCSKRNSSEFVRIECDINMVCKE